MIQNANKDNFKILDPIQPEFEHIVGKEFKYDQLLLELRKSGVILYPATQDLEHVGLPVKVKL